MRYLCNTNDVQHKLQLFDDECKKGYARTVSRLCVHLNCTRNELKGFLRSAPYNNKDGDISASQKLLRAALLKCEMFYEDMLFTKDCCPGAKFALENHFAWSSRAQIEQKTDTHVTVEWGAPSALDNSTIISSKPQNDVPALPSDSAPFGGEIPCGTPADEHDDVLAGLL